MTITRVAPAKAARQPNAKEYLYLRPTRCGFRAGDASAADAVLSPCKAIDYDQVLQATIARICTDLPQAVAGMPAPNFGAIKAGIDGQIAQRQAVLDQLPDLLSSGILDAETALLRTYNLRTEMAMLQSQLAQLPPPNLGAIAQAVSIPQFWLDLSESERRFYLREFLRQIEIIREGADRSQWTLKLIFAF
jgi:hypothetical protein